MDYKNPGISNNNYTIEFTLTLINLNQIKINKSSDSYRAQRHKLNSVNIHETIYNLPNLEKVVNSFILTLTRVMRGITSRLLLNS